MKVMLIFGLGYAVSACAGPHLEPAHAEAAPAPEAGSEPAQPPDEPVVQDDSVDPATAIVALCAAVQQSVRLPIGCQVDMVEGIARMQLVMSDPAAFESFGASAINDLAAPFCAVANAAEQPAGVVVSVYSER